MRAPGFSRLISIMKPILLLLALFPCALHAAQWDEVTSKAPDIVVSIDLSSVSVNDYIVKGWVKFDYQVPREYQGRLLLRETSQRQVNCKERTFWVIEGYGQTEDASDEIRIYNNMQYWTTPAPDSKDEAAYMALCRQTESIFEKAVDKVIEEYDRTKSFIGETIDNVIEGKGQ